jgi:hypothetical protein
MQKWPFYWNFRRAKSNELYKWFMDHFFQTSYCLRCNTLMALRMAGLERIVYMLWISRTYVVARPWEAIPHKEFWARSCQDGKTAPGIDVVSSFIFSEAIWSAKLQQVNAILPLKFAYHTHTSCSLEPTHSSSELIMLPGKRYSPWLTCANGSYCNLFFKLINVSHL